MTEQQYPTREQIAEAIALEIGGVDPDRWRMPLWRSGLDAEWTGDVRRAADAVLAIEFIREQCRYPVTPGAGAGE